MINIKQEWLGNDESTFKSCIDYCFKWQRLSIYLTEHERPLGSAEMLQKGDQMW